MREEEKAEDNDTHDDIFTDTITIYGMEGHGMALRMVFLGK